MITSEERQELDSLGFLEKDIQGLSCWESDQYIITELKNSMGFALYKKNINTVPDTVDENGNTLTTKDVYTGLASSVEKTETVGEYNLELKSVERKKEAKIYQTAQAAIDIYKSVKDGNATS